MKQLECELMTVGELSRRTGLSCIVFAPVDLAESRGRRH
jgi:hypothetical protein